MCIYCGTNHYRRIYENHYGEIPKDDIGRSYEIHHIDGNHDNNDPNNLTCISIKEHYDIHFEQQDWGACFAISTRMGYDRKTISEMASKVARENAIKRIEDGTHNFLGSDLQLKRVNDGTHPFLGGEIARKTQLKRVQDGTHHLLSGEIQRKTMRSLIAQGIHPIQIKITCEYCNREYGTLNYKRWHGKNCKLRK